LAACGSDGGSGADAGPADAGSAQDASAPKDWPQQTVPAVTTPEPGVERVVTHVDGAVPPANPMTGDETPERLNRVRVLRYRATPHVEPRAVIVAIPGIFGGGATFQALARHLVRRGAEADAPLEVWAIDRRANLLEDLRGMNTAEAMDNPRLAQQYYFGRETVGGQGFEGFLRQSEVPFMSEWGLQTHVHDVRSVIHAVPEQARRARVFLMGHSLGASMTEAYAAWRFEQGGQGSDELAGIILVDGALGGDPVTETQYMEGFGSGFMRSPGLEAIRSETRYVELPFLGASIYAVAEIVAMDALVAPDERAPPFRAREEAFGLLLGLGPDELPAMTRVGALGWGFDEGSNALSFAAVGMGQPTGGPTEMYDSAFGARLERPADPEATYDWIDAPDAQPPEATPWENLAHTWVNGRSNFAEWYFPARLSLDLAAVAGLDVAPEGWRWERGLRAADGAEMDAPILAVAAGLQGVGGFETSRQRAAPLGEGRPNAGAIRDDPKAFRVIDATSLTHLDPLTGADGEGNPVPAAVTDFVLRIAPEGSTPVELAAP
jgi:dienelactone hydrolase